MTATDTLQTFNEAPVRSMPQRVCLGSIAQIKDGYVSKKGTYIVQPFELLGRGAAPSITFYWLYRPAWLCAGFDPAREYDDRIPEQKSLLSVYRRHIAGAKQTSSLKGLAGSEEGYRVLANAILSANLNHEADDFTESIDTI